MTKYSHVSIQKRRLLISLVIQNEKTIVSAAKKLRVKLPTAKSIIRTYRNSGHVFQKKGKAKDNRPIIPIVERKSSISNEKTEKSSYSQAQNFDNANQEVKSQMTQNEMMIQFLNNQILQLQEACKISLLMTDQPFSAWNQCAPHQS